MHVARSMGAGAVAGAVAVPVRLPLGARVWLPRENRRGRVVVRVLDGLLYRVRLDGGPEGLLERPACELEPLCEDEVR